MKKSRRQKRRIWKKRIQDPVKAESRLSSDDTEGSRFMCGNGIAGDFRYLYRFTIVKNIQILGIC